MATIVSAETLEAVPRGDYVRYRYRYVLDTGFSWESRAWILSTEDADADRAKRGASMLETLAEREAGELLNG